MAVFVQVNGIGEGYSNHANYLTNLSLEIIWFGLYYKSLALGLEELSCARQRLSLAKKKYDKPLF